jgi:hypothetical protein
VPPANPTASAPSASRRRPAEVIQTPHGYGEEGDV